MELDKIIIRKIKEEEIDQLVYLCKLHAEFEEANYDSTDKSEYLRKYIFGENPVLKCAVAVKNDSLLGYITFTKEFSTWSANYYYHMDCLYLMPDARKLGLGKKLMDFMRLEANKEKIEHIEWQTPVFNENAIDFYRHIGARSKPKVRFFLDLVK